MGVWTNLPAEATNETIAVFEGETRHRFQVGCISSACIRPVHVSRLLPSAHITCQSCLLGGPSTSSSSSPDSSGRATCQEPILASLSDVTYFFAGLVNNAIILHSAFFFAVSRRVQRCGRFKLTEPRSLSVYGLEDVRNTLARGMSCLFFHTYSSYWPPSTTPICHGLCYEVIGAFLSLLPFEFSKLFQAGQYLPSETEHDAGLFWKHRQWLVAGFCRRSRYRRLLTPRSISLGCRPKKTPPRSCKNFLANPSCHNMSFLQIPYREARDGFWGEQTSTLNWCEEVSEVASETKAERLTCSPPRRITT